MKWSEDSLLSLLADRSPFLTSYLSLPSSPTRLLQTSLYPLPLEVK